MSKWKKARKKPVVVEFREVMPNCKAHSHRTDEPPVDAEKIETREGTLFGYPNRDFIIRGVEGEIYPIDKKIFAKTYDTVDENKYLEYHLVETKPKTGVYHVVSKTHGDVLGVIRWYAPWRQYVFEPSSKTVWNRDCLYDVSLFLIDLMARRGVAAITI